MCQCPWKPLNKVNELDDADEVYGNYSENASGGGKSTVKTGVARQC